MRSLSMWMSLQIGATRLTTLGNWHFFLFWSRLCQELRRCTSSFATTVFWWHCSAGKQVMSTETQTTNYEAKTSPLKAFGGQCRGVQSCLACKLRRAEVVWQTNHWIRGSTKLSRGRVIGSKCGRRFNGDKVSKLDRVKPTMRHMI